MNFGWTSKWRSFCIQINKYNNINKIKFKRIAHKHFNYYFVVLNYNKPIGKTFKRLFS